MIGRVFLELSLYIMLPGLHEDEVRDEAEFIIALAELPRNEARKLLYRASKRQLHALQVMAKDILTFQTVLNPQQRLTLAKDAPSVRKLVGATTIKSLREIVSNAGINLIRRLILPELPAVKEYFDSAQDEEADDSTDDQYEKPPTSVSNETTVEGHDANQHGGSNAARYSLQSKFKCEVCEKVLSRATHYRNHMRLHSAYEERPFKCECGRRYSSSTNLNEHRRLKH